jgi:hypothetical protein
MGVTAENVAKEFGITREQQDALALEPPARRARLGRGPLCRTDPAHHAQEPQGRGGLRQDEHFRAGAKLEDQKMKPVFVKENGTVTAGNASGINDAAAAVLLMEAATAKARGKAAGAPGGLRPRRRRAQDHGHRPGAGHQAVLARTGLKLDQMDVIEANEAFAAQACAVTKAGADPAKVNPNGSGISLGHPIGATGALITVKALYELQRIKGKYALVTMCIGGGQASPRCSSACERPGVQTRTKKPALAAGFGPGVTRPGRPRAPSGRPAGPARCRHRDQPTPSRSRGGQRQRAAGVCSTSSMVTPWAYTSRTTSKILSTMMGDRPIEGSSSSSSLGRPSARGPWPASAARRPTWCRPAGPCARAGAGRW